VTLSQLQSDEALRRREFPVVQTKVFLGHAGVCPLPRRVSEAISHCATASTTGDQEALFFPAAISRCRELAAQLLQCDTAEIALVGPTSLALSMVAAGLPFEPGENMVVYFDDYPSNVYPWMALAERGVEIRRVPAAELGEITLDAVMACVDSKTRLVALASCHFIGGLRIDIDAIGRALHDLGILFCVDGIQTLGVFPTSVRHVDFLAADAHKWMLGPCAAGILYVSHQAQEQLKPVMLGWHNIRCPDFVAQDTLVLRGGAQRYEAGTHNLIGIVGLNAALGLLLEVGVEHIGREVLRKRAHLVHALLAKGWDVLHAQAGNDRASGIVSFRREDQDPTQLQARLSEHGVVAAARADRRGRRFIRVSPHFYNSDQELHRFLELV
jgi:selenocysteine lyase/cysteine desulfurase